MFKCKECGQEFRIKPDYCDCGNDIFDEIILNVVQPAQSNQSTLHNINSTKVDFVAFLVRRNITVFGLSFFIICLVLSAFIWIFCFNFSSEQIPVNSKKNIEKNLSKIPDIDKLWDDTPAQNTRVEPIKKQQKIEVKSNVNTSSQTLKTSPAKTQRSVLKTVPKQVSTVSKSNKSTNVSKQNKTVVKKQTKVTQQVTTPVKTAQEPTSAANKVVPTPSAVKKKATPVYSAELNNYKIALRNALFSKLSVVSIQGSGDCGVEFSIDSTGKLINRSFSYQSHNKSVNDEVYKMLMRLPSFYPPPEAYKGEKIKMTFSFDNGNYVINYTN